MSESHLYFFFVCANPFNTLDIPVSAFESQLPNVTQSSIILKEETDFIEPQLL